jgi:Flp pilus assembly protein TadG
MDRWLRQRKRGDAILEFALLAPALLIVLFGIIEVGRVVDTWLVVHNAAREGARVGAQATAGQDPATTAQQAALRYLSTGLGTRTDVVATLVPTPTVTADNVQVSAQVQLQVYMPLIQMMVASPVNVGASASMRRQ